MLFQMSDNNNLEAINLLTNLVSIPSPSEHEAAAAAYLVDWLNRRGLTAAIDVAGNAVGLKGDGPKEILLLGHIDTFPGHVPVRRQDNLLYGRGTVDAKGPLCTFAAAATQVDVPPGWRVTVVGAVEEECATSKGARFVLSQRRGEEAQKRGNEENLFSPPRLLASSPHPVFCIIGEPSHWDRVTLGYKGRLLMEASLRAPFSHSAGEGRLPAEQGMDFWRQVEQFCADFNVAHQADTPFNQLTPSLRQICSHDEDAYGRVKLEMGFRLPVGLTPVQLERQLRQLTGLLPPETTAAIQFSGGELAYKGDKTNPLVRAFLAAIRAAGGQPRFVVKTGTADMNVVGPQWPHTPMVAYGPGDSSLDHTPHEHLDLNEYLRAIGVLQTVLVKLME
jgi:LysW-gamma-L-lysine carboxypeptidase